MNDWTIFDKRNLPTVECWYAYGFGFEIEWSPVFRGAYFKALCIEFHLGFWKHARGDRDR